MPSSPVETRCYVLAPEGAAPGAEIATLAAQRGWSVETAADPLATLARVAGLERDESARSAWGLRRRLDQALVVVPPESSGGFGEVGLLIDAIRRYLPDLPAWLLTAGTLSPLTRGSRVRERVNGAMASGRGAPRPPAPAAAPAESAPPRAAREEEEEKEAAPTRAPASLDAEEIRMLLNRADGGERTSEPPGEPTAPSERPSPQPPPLPSASAAPGVELRLATPMTPDEAGDDGAWTDDEPEAVPGRITAEEMRMLFEPDPETPARS